MEKYMVKKSEQTPLPESVEQEIAKQNFTSWNDALKTGDLKKVAALYSNDATFLPTVSGEFKKGQIGAEKYFKLFLKKNPSGEIIQEKIQFLATGCYLHTGMYNFEVGPEDGRQVVEARFSFVWKRNAQTRWEIIHHHSSIRPEE